MLRGAPRVFLKLDFDKAEAELNGIRGSIHSEFEKGMTRIFWTDLAILGSPVVTMQTIGEKVVARLRFQDATADFICVRKG